MVGTMEGLMAAEDARRFGRFPGEGGAERPWRSVSMARACLIASVMLVLGLAAW